MKLPPPFSATIQVTQRESAPWITMVHGASHDQRYFSSQVQAFQQDYRLLLIDLPGHGQSASLPGPYGLEEYAVSVLAAMDAAGVDESHYLGSHTGAAVALILASHHGQRFQSLTLESAPIPGLDLPSVTEALRRARATARELGIDAARAEWFERGRWFEIIRKDPQRCRADQHRAMISEFSGRPWLDTTPAQPVAPLLDRLDSIHCPVLLINGEHDVEDFLLAAGELERRLPRIQRVTVAGAGGFPLWEDPKQANDHIRRHLRDACMKS